MKKCPQRTIEKLLKIQYLMVDRQFQTSSLGARGICPRIKIQISIFWLARTSVQFKCNGSGKSTTTIAYWDLRNKCKDLRISPEPSEEFQTTRKSVWRLPSSDTQGLLAGTMRYFRARDIFRAGSAPGNFFLPKQFQKCSNSLIRQKKNYFFWPISDEVQPGQFCRSLKRGGVLLWLTCATGRFARIESDCLFKVRLSSFIN